MIYLMSFQSRYVLDTLLSTGSYTPSMRKMRGATYYDQYSDLACVVNNVDYDNLGDLSSVFTILDVDRTCGTISNMLANLPMEFPDYLLTHDLEQENTLLFDLVYPYSEAFVYEAYAYKKGDITEVTRDSIVNYRYNHLWANVPNITIDNINAVYTYNTHDIHVNLLDSVTGNLVASDVLIANGCHRLGCIYGNDYLQQFAYTDVNYSLTYRARLRNWLDDGLTVSDMRIL